MVTAKALITLPAGKVAGIRHVPIPKIRDEWILVKTKAVALNPTDWKHIDGGWSDPGSRSGCDYAGVVEEVGSKVTEFVKGDRVFGFAHGGNSLDHEAGAFGEYILVKACVQIKIPDNLSFEQAAALPVGIFTCGQGLYKALKLPLPNQPTKQAFPILIHGGSTSMGVLGIQFAKASGLTVVATASPHNFEYLKSLGADAVFDYRSPTCGVDINKITGNKLRHAWDCVGSGETICAAALSSSESSAYAYINVGADTELLRKINPMVDQALFTLAYLINNEYCEISSDHKFPAMPEQMEQARMFKEVARELLEKGVIKPIRMAINKGGSGLEGILTGLDELRHGKVSGMKLVYTIDTDTTVGEQPNASGNSLTAETSIKDYKFQGWLGHNEAAAQGQMEWGSFEPKKWREDDVDIQVTHCGVCGTDAHVLRSDWGPTPYPCCVGHEIVGKVVRVGSLVKGLKPGDRVGVGPQARSCQRSDCYECMTGQANYCPQSTPTYGAVYPGDEGKSYGGYGDYSRTNCSFVFKIPDGLASEHVAPMLCAGSTVYPPLKKYGCGPGKAVGVVGIGGLGHFTILFAKALDAGKIVAISRTSSKRQDSLAFGADEYIATAEDADWASKHARSLDLIIVTASSPTLPVDSYIKMLKVGGTLAMLGAHEGGQFPPFNALGLLYGGVNIAGSICGSEDDVAEMLELAAQKGIKPWVQTMPMDQANQALIDLEEGKPRYRLVLVNEKHL